MKKNLDVLIGQIILVALGIGLIIFSIYMRLYPEIVMGRTIAEKDIMDSFLWLITYGSKGFQFFVVSVVFFAIAILLQYPKKRR